MKPQNTQEFPESEIYFSRLLVNIQRMKTKLYSLAFFMTACAPMPFVQPTPPQPQQQYYQQAPAQGAPPAQQYAPAGTQLSQAGAIEQGLTPHTAIPIQPGVAIQGIFQNNTPKKRYYSMPIQNGTMVRFTPALTVSSGRCYLHINVNNSSQQKVDSNMFSSDDPSEFWEFRALYDDTYQIVLDPSCSGSTISYNVTIQSN